jgi:hypothetical protein
MLLNITKQPRMHFLYRFVVLVLFLGAVNYGCIKIFKYLKTNILEQYGYNTYRLLQII